MIKNVRFVVSNNDITKCPKTNIPEYAFIGRSNVGKSSLINMITGQKNLAKTSSTPGKTQLINHFIINDSWYLVDLPGLGFARTSKQNKGKWERMISDYLLKRRNLLSTFVLIDSRLEPQKIDTDFISWMGESQLPFVIVFTKTDKLSTGKVVQHVKKYKNFLLNTWDELPSIILSSAKTFTGKSEILSFIKETNKVFNKTDR